MVNWTMTICGIALALAGCAPAGKWSRPNECYMSTHDAANRRRLSVANNQKWCSFFWEDLYGGGNIHVRGDAIILAPAHGELRVTHRPDKTWFDYRRDIGYAGPDAFKVEAGGAGKRQYLIDVEVKAPPRT